MERIATIANFLNECIDYDKKVKPIEGENQILPWYLRTDIFSRGSREWAIHLMRSNDVFVIAKSLNYPPMKMLENDMVHAGYSCYITESRINYKCAENKIVFTTLEALTLADTRSVVIVMMAEMSAQDLFRAGSRATERLYLIDDARSEEIPMIVNEKYVNNVNKRANGLLGHRRSVIKPLDHLEEPKLVVIQQPISKISIPYTNNQHFVADITGLAIPMIYEYKTKGSIAIVDLVRNHHKCERTYIRFLNVADFKVTANILKLANIYLTLIKGYKSKLYDISNTEYTWLSDDIITELLNRMKKYISEQAEYEVKIGTHRVDVVDNNIIWEIKCKKYMNFRDKLQLARYAKADKFKRKYKLLNLYTEEILEIDTSDI